jgi:CMP-N-acetylneuraminic acid synthetase
MKPTIIAMIPARLGSQRLKQKNLLKINDVPIISLAMRKANSLSCFDEVWVNSESDIIGQLAADEGIKFHKRPEHLGGNNASSEEFVHEFLLSHPCDYLVQLHSIAPLITRDEIERFVEMLSNGKYDTLLSGVNEQIHCLMDGQPLNFSKDKMDATQEMAAIQRVSWSITGWRTSAYLSTFEQGSCATFNGALGFFNLSRPSGLVIKTEEDYLMAKALVEAGFGWS